MSNRIPRHKPDIYTILSTLLGIGFVPVMPGTFGTAAAAFLYLMMRESSVSFAHPSLSLLSLIVLGTVLGVFITGKAEKKLGNDAGCIIWDEFIGYFVAVLFLPQTLAMAIYTFAIFRVFDIAKPWPIKLSQKLKGGWGIMIDDVIAGAFTNVFMQILIRIYPSFFGI